MLDVYCSIGTTVYVYMYVFKSAAVQCKSDECNSSCLLYSLLIEGKDWGSL